MRCGFAIDQDAVKELETAEESTTETSGDGDLELALKIVRAMREDEEGLEGFIDGFG